MKAPMLAAAILTVLGARPALAQTPDGRALYMTQCRTCHGVAGKPTDFGRRTFPHIPTLSDSAFIAGLSQDSIVAVLTHGAGDATQMPSFKAKLTREQMIAVARYVRTLRQQGHASP